MQEFIWRHTWRSTLLIRRTCASILMFAAVTAAVAEPAGGVQIPSVAVAQEGRQELRVDWGRPVDPQGGNLVSSVVSTTGEVAGAVFSQAGKVAGAVANRAGDLVMNAMSLLGVRYRYGGNSPETGLDCSGFVRYVFNDTLGFLLPRRAKDMSEVGATVSRSELQPGDLVFFNTMRRTFSHVGIYVGDNKFVHAPSSGGNIRVDDMTASYWATRFNGARRIEEVGRSEVRARFDELLGNARKGEGKL